METLVTGYGRSPFSLKPGERLRSDNLVSTKRPKILSVAPPNTDGYIILTTEEGQHSFAPGQPVAFPRRANGQAKLHWDPQPSLVEVKVGDIVAPPGGWPNGRPDLTSGRMVTDILPSRRNTGFIVSYRPVNGDPGGKVLVPVYNAFLNTPDCMEYGKTQKPRFTAEPKNASGKYVHLETGQEVRFRIKGVKGRPPHCDLKDSPSTDIADWDPWQLLSGKRHPDDPRSSS